ncbi:MAG TPA: hypothetical protein VFU06_11660 [Longimicrobiales bacterium]|nr:hypothetical protein [Longimicrobiales bacterium]
MLETTAAATGRGHWKSAGELAILRYDNKFGHFDEERRPAAGAARRLDGHRAIHAAALPRVR